jgi:hypothetical protein
MGRNNRQRRADKRRKRERTRGSAPRDPFDLIDAADVAELMAFEAAEAAEHDEAELLEEALRQLGGLGAIGWRALTGSLVAGLRAAWEGGWQPADVFRAAHKRLGAAEAELVAEMIALEGGHGPGVGSGMPEAWAAQLRDLARTVRDDEARWGGPGCLRLGVRLLGLLIHLPVMPNLMPPPSQWGRMGPRRAAAAAGVDERVLERVRALLAKAESTSFTEEAEALTVKAQELMARFSIDQAMLSVGMEGEEPCGRRIGVEDPYAQGKASLLASIAAANRCQAAWSEAYGFSTVVGFPGDIDIVEMVFVSLLLQATRAMTSAGAVRDSSGRSRTRSFRQSFMFSFARRIGERLDAATRAATSAAGEVHGDQLLPVLAGRASAVDDAFEALFPHLTSSAARVSNLAGWAAGRAAADLARLGPEQQLLPGIAV